jgi:hypothetical protein
MSKIPNYPQHDIDYVTNNHLLIPCKRIAKHLGRSQSYVRSLKRFNNIVTPPHIVEIFRKSTHIKPGNIPFNKGRKMTEYLTPETIQRISKIFFKPGHLNHNALHDGAITIRNEKNIPYYFIRLSSGHWEKLSRYIYQLQHGPIPKSVNIQFKDGNTMNCILDNLYAIKRRHQTQINKYGGKKIPYELQKTIILITDIKRNLNAKQNYRPEQSSVCTTGTAQ